MEKMEKNILTKKQRPYNLGTSISNNLIGKTVIHKSFVGRLEMRPIEYIISDSCGYEEDYKDCQIGMITYFDLQNIMVGQVLMSYKWLFDNYLFYFYNTPCGVEYDVFDEDDFDEDELLDKDLDKEFEDEDD